MTKGPRPAPWSGEWSRENLAWLAGLLEGEGCFTVRTDSYNKKQYFTLRLNMTDFDVVRRAHAIAGVGTLYGPYDNKGNRKPSLIWAVSSEAQSVALAAAIWPWMGERRRARITELIVMWRDRERVVATNANGRWRSGR